MEALVLADSEALVEALIDADVLADSEALVEALIEADVLADSLALVEALSWMRTYLQIRSHLLMHSLTRTDCCRFTGTCWKRSSTCTGTC